MMIFIVLVLTLIPSVAILYPFFKGKENLGVAEESTSTDLTRSWDYIVEGLKNAELDNVLGNISDEDYMSVKKKYVAEAARIMADMEAYGYEKGRLPTNSFSDLNKSCSVSGNESPGNQSC